MNLSVGLQRALSVSGMRELANVNSPVSIHVFSTVKDKKIARHYVDIGSLLATQIEANLESNLSLTALGSLILNSPKNKR